MRPLQLEITEVKNLVGEMKNSVLSLKNRVIVAEDSELQDEM